MIGVVRWEGSSCQKERKRHQQERASAESKWKREIRSQMMALQTLGKRESDWRRTKDHKGSRKLGSL